MTYTIVVCKVKNSDGGQTNCPKYVEFYSKNKFQKLVHLVGFIIRIELIVSVYTPVSIQRFKSNKTVCHFDNPKDNKTSEVMHFIAL